MERKSREFAKLLGSRWTFRLTLLVFAAEAGWLAATSRFPMAYDEAYHFGLIRFFAHRINPIVIKQASDTYGFGPLVHNTAPLYHYTLGLEYRLIELFTHNLEAQLICLRLTNVALAIASLIVVRKLLRLLRLSDALANTLVIILALTPIMTVVSAQVNYDNLFILATTVCMYQFILLIRQFQKGIFDSKRFLILLCLCLYSSLIKFAFLPIFTAMAIIAIWKAIAFWRSDAAAMTASARRSFAAMSWRLKLLLIMVCTVGVLLFSWFYLVNLVEYHNPAPQCQQVLSIQQCKQYAPWDYLYIYQQYYHAHPASYHMGPLQYGGWWLTANLGQVYGTQIPVKGTVGVPSAYLLTVMLVGAAGFVYFAGNFRKISRQHPEIPWLLSITFVYVFCLLYRNYHDYLRTGLLPAAVHGRYLLPLLIYVYIALALGVQYVLRGKGRLNLAIKSALALILILVFVYYGGFREYLSFVNPAYGRLSSSDFVTSDSPPSSEN